MSLIIQKFESFLQEFDLSKTQVYKTGGGQIALNETGDLAIVWTDGRYPEIEKGYSLNSVCEEKITVLFGTIILEIEDKFLVLKSKDSYEVKPGNKYSIAGKAVCKVEISPKWDSLQNSFVF